MKSILSFIAATTSALAVTSSVGAETTVAILEFGKGGAVRRATASQSNGYSTPAAIASFWKALHQPSNKQQQYASMSLVPDIFHRADAGVIIALSGASVESIPTAMNLMNEGATDVIGHMHVASMAGSDLVKRVAKQPEVVTEKDLFGRLIDSIVDKTSKGLDEIEVASLVVDDQDSATVADKHLKRMLQTLKQQAQENDKTVIVHLVVENKPTQRRLQENNQDANANNQNDGSSSYYYGQKTMYEIQNFNVIAWTAVGLVGLVFFVMSAFVAMPLMPDTLLFGEASKLGSD